MLCFTAFVIYLGFNTGFNSCSGTQDLLESDEYLIQFSSQIGK